MVFTTTNLFKGIPCPYAPQCALTNCIYSHELRPQLTESIGAQHQTTQLPDSTEGPAVKRRKIAGERWESRPLTSRADQIRSELAASLQTASDAPGVNSQHGKSSVDAQYPLPSLIKPVTPPLTNGKAAGTSSKAGADIHRADNNNNDSNSSLTLPNSDKKESLNPRLLPNDPAGHAKRSLYLKHLHAEMVRLQKALSGAAGSQSGHSTMLSEQQLINMALTEEEQIAKEQPMVYANMIKQRIAFYKKIKVDAWALHVTEYLGKDKPKATTGKVAKTITTGLSTEQELAILPSMVADQTSLPQFGYVVLPPTEVQIAEAAAAVEASKNFEVCDRCAARFQVFPDRSEEGRLTSNGPCLHHPNRKAFPHKTKGDVVSGLPKEPYYPCCNNIVGTPGCTEAEDHVFKVTSPARLAATLPFITTPKNDKPALDRHGDKVNAVAFDCEMGYTTQGLELIRLTAVSWPSAEKLIDVLVRPLGTIIDLNSRFSGVWPESFSNAIPYSQYQASMTTVSNQNGARPASAIPIVDSPQAARSLLCTFLTPMTPLIGHAIDNDLNAARLCHPSIVDTVLLWPHPRGLPMRQALRALSSTHLGRSIQTGGSRGHDSLEDAQATGDLVRVKIGERWKVLQSKGWRIEGEKLIPPATLQRAEEDTKTTDRDRQQNVTKMVARIFDEQAAGKKRRKGMGASGGAEGTEDEGVPLGNGVAAYLKFTKGGEINKA